MIRVRLSPFIGAESGEDAVLLIDCLLGSPPAGEEEGVQLRVSGGPEFTEQVSGENLFIKLERSRERTASVIEVLVEDIDRLTRKIEKIKFPEPMYTRRRIGYVTDKD